VFVFGAALGMSTALTVPAGAATVKEAQYGFSFSLPPKWTQIPLDSSDIGAIIGQATKSDPSLKNVLDQQALQASKKGLKVFAVGPVSNGFFPNLNIGVTSTTTAPTGSAFISLMSAEVKITLAEAGATQVTVGSPHLPMGQVVQVSYEVQLKMGGRAVSVHGLQFYAEHGAHLYVITISGTTLAEDKSTAHVVETTWHWQAKPA
jgi:hypothetical protein